MTGHPRNPGLRPINGTAPLGGHTDHDFRVATPARRRAIVDAIAKDSGFRDADHMRRVIAGHRELGYFGGTRVRRG